MQASARLLPITSIDLTKYGFRQEKWTKKDVYVSSEDIHVKKHREMKKELCMVFIDSEKAYYLNESPEES